MLTILATIMSCSSCCHLPIFIYSNCPSHYYYYYYYYYYYHYYDYCYDYLLSRLLILLNRAPSRVCLSLSSVLFSPGVPMARNHPGFLSHLVWRCGTLMVSEGLTLPRGSRMYLGPSNSQVLRPPNTSGVSNGGVGSSIESPRSLWVG